MANKSIIFGISGKKSRNENFPVASFLLPKKHRGHVIAFYDFARAADDVADSRTLGPEDKLAILGNMEKVLLGSKIDGETHFVEASTMHSSLSETGVSAIHCRDLIKAFRQDVVKNTYTSWQELMGYCSLSAAPVGRYLMDVTGQPSGDRAPSDALCAALQVLNHLQDMKTDYIELGRVYLPSEWLAEEGANARDLSATKMSPALKRVTQRVIAGIDDLLVAAAPLGKNLSGPLGREASGIHKIAQRLSDKLKQGDPLSGRVELGKVKSLFWFLHGATLG